jgi:hypothetical protein
MDSKVCSRCKLLKQYDDFYPERKSKDGFGWRCKSCVKTQMSTWYATNKEYVSRRNKTPAVKARRRAAQKRYDETPGGRAQNRATKLRLSYGITADEWDSMLIAQAGRCASCGDQFTDALRAIHVDHCHDSRVVRALLCRTCNIAEGVLGGDPDRIRSLLAYVLRWRESA